jgi:hypothetical protein
LCRQKWQLVHCANLWGGSFPFYEAEEVCLATEDVNSTWRVCTNIVNWPIVVTPTESVHFAVRAEAYVRLMLSLQGWCTRGNTFQSLSRCSAGSAHLSPSSALCLLAQTVATNVICMF